MGFDHAALYTFTVVVLCTMMVVSSSPASRTQLVFEPGRSLSRTYGSLKLKASSSLQHHTRVTKLTAPPVITTPPTISNATTNGTNNGTLIFEVCMDCVCYCCCYLFMFSERKLVSVIVDIVIWFSHFVVMLSCLYSCCMHQLIISTGRVHAK